MRPELAPGLPRRAAVLAVVLAEAWLGVGCGLGAGGLAADSDDAGVLHGADAAADDSAIGVVDASRGDDGDDTASPVASIDADLGPGPTDDSGVAGPDGGGPVAAALCASRCSGTGAGTCMGGTCVIACTPGGCPKCPAGIPCSVTAPPSYDIAVDCSAASQCVVDCAGTESCGAVTCAGSSCAVTCGTSSCTGPVTCNAGTCDVTCSGVSSCSGKVTATAGTSHILCSGTASCSSRTACSGLSCAITCGSVTTCSGAVCCGATACTIDGVRSVCP